MAYNDGLTAIPHEWRERAGTMLLRYVADEHGCHVWSGMRNPRGYGVVRFGKRSVMAHRAAWLFHVGEIERGLVLDHVCLNHSCINVEHLQVVSTSENIRRAVELAQASGPSQWTKIEMCRKGLHPMTPDNIRTQRVKDHVSRMCAQCIRDRTAKYRREHPDQIAAYEAKRKSRPSG